MHPPADNAPLALERPKSGSVRGLIRGSTLLLFGRLLSKLSNFAAQVLIVRYLSQTAYGQFAYALSVVNMAQSFMTLGLDQAMVRFLAIFHEQRDTRRLFGTIMLSLVVVLSVALVAVLVLYGFQGPIGRSVRDQQTLALLMVLIFLAPIQALDDLLVGTFAVFAKPRAIFFRRYVLAPGLKVVVVVALVLSRSDVFFLASGYLAASLLGVVIYGFLLFRVFRDQGLLENWSWRGLVRPWREVLGFSIPLLTTNLVFVTMNAMSVVLLEHFWGTTSVANFRAVEPAANVSQLVMASFATLFTPMAARMFANNDRVGISHLYWRSAIWIAILSFPVFVVTFSLAHPITILLYGSRYEQAAPILAMLSLGYYFNAALGFNGLTLRIFGKVRYTVILNVATAVVNLAVNLILIPRLGALGAGIGMMVALIVHNLLKQGGLLLGTGISLFEWRYLRVYLMIGICALGLLAFQAMTTVPVYVNLGLAALATLFVFWMNRKMLEVDQMFPEAMRIPGMRFLVSGRWR